MITFDSLVAPVRSWLGFGGIISRGAQYSLLLVFISIIYLTLDGHDLVLPASSVLKDH